MLAPPLRCSIHRFLDAKDYASMTHAHLPATELTMEDTYRSNEPMTVADAKEVVAAYAPGQSAPRRSVRDPAIVSYTMSRIRSKDTKPEMALRRAVWRAGLRYRKHYGKVPGRPDIAFVGAKIAVFCDGNFWHGRDWEVRRERLTSSSRDYWIKKIERNMERDRAANRRLEELGWLVLRFWEDEVLSDPARCVDIVRSALEARRPGFKAPVNHPD